MRCCANGKGLVSGTIAVVNGKPGALIPCAIWDGDVDRLGKHLRMIFDESGVFVLKYPTVHDNHCILEIKCWFANDALLSLVLYHAAAMSILAMPNPPSRNPSAKKRKYDQLDPPPPPLHHYRPMAPFFTSRCAHCHLPSVVVECRIIAGLFSWHLTTSQKLTEDSISSARLARNPILVMDLVVAKGPEYQGEGSKSQAWSSNAGASKGSSRPPRPRIQTMPRRRLHGNSRSRTSACNHPERQTSGYSCRGSRT